MSTNLHRVLQNYAWRTQAITPTAGNLVSGVAIHPQFREYDPIKEPKPQASSGWARRFFVEYIGSDADEFATDADRREAIHLIRLHVMYPAIYEHKALQMLIVQDRHDINLTLRSRGRAYVKGYDDDNTAADIGLYQRKRKGDTVDRTLVPGVWIYTVEWLNKIRESE